MVHTPRSHESIHIDSSFQHKYPLGTQLVVTLENGESPLICSVDSYTNMGGKRISVGITTTKPGTDEQIGGLITMDSHANPALYFFSKDYSKREKIGIIYHIEKVKKIPLIASGNKKRVGELVEHRV